MNDDELRDRLARLDPQAEAPVDPISSPRAQDLLERIMTTETQTPAPRRNRLLLAAAAGIAAVGVIAAVALNSGEKAPAGKTVLALKAPPGAGGPVMSSCIQFDVQLLSQEPVAFAGKATSVSPTSVRLDVTKWYKGGSAEVVEVSTPDSSNVSIEGVTFEEGKEYLVSANEGTVVSCGFSGPDSSELRAAYEQAFG